MFSTINDVYANVITNIQTQMDLSIKEIKKIYKKKRYRKWTFEQQIIWTP